MIFTTQRHPTNEYSSSHEKFLSITGLAAVIGVLAGAGLMIYGLTKDCSACTISGAVTLGISTLVAVGLVLLYFFYFKKNRPSPHPDDQRTSNQHHRGQHQHHSNQHRHANHHAPASHGAAAVHGMHSNHQHRPAGPPSTGFSTNHSYSKQVSNSIPSSQSHGLQTTRNSRTRH